MSELRSVINPTTHFQSKWMDFVRFRSWLAPVHWDTTKAWCNFCDRMFRADINVLRLHCVSKSHIRKMFTHGNPDDDNARPLKVKKRNKSMNDSATFSPIESNTTEEMITSEMETQSEHGKYIVVLPNENDGPHTSSSDTQFIQEEVNVIDKSCPLVSSVNEHFAQINEGNADDFEVDLQSEEYHSPSRYKKTDQKHDGVKHKAMVSKPAPFWKATAVVNGYVTELNLNDFKGSYLVLFFYPGDFSKVCLTEILALGSRVSEFRALRTEIVACSVDSYLSHQVWFKELISDGNYAMPELPLLSDPTHAISKSYGCYLPELGHSLRAHYIIDTRGILRHVTINDLAVGRNIKEIIRLIQAFQYTD